MKELVSIVIPTYGRYKELFKAIDSVINQTYENIEIIIIDDNANDLILRNKIKENLQKYAQVQIQYVANPKNLGGGKSRNIGIEIAKGKYLAFLDDDDEYYPEKIEKQYKLYQEKNKEKIRNDLLLCRND